MNDRSALGSADVPDDTLAAMAADLLDITDTAPVTLVESATRATIARYALDLVDATD